MGLTVALLVLVIVATVAAVAISIHRRRQRLPYLTAEDKAAMHLKWHAIEQRLAKGGPTQYRQAVIEADTLVDHCLKKAGVPGQSMGERLRRSGDRFTDYQGLWTAHKLRNQLVHELDRELLSFEAKQQLARFRRALADLGVL